VKLEDKGKGLFYLGLNQFTDVTPVEMSDAISKILLSNPRGVILDLRDNGGGYLEVAIEILSELISGKREVVTIRKRDLKDDEIKFSSGSGRLASIPLVILINGASASASEIVAGAVQDLKRGTLVGEKSYGKGSVQEIEDNLKEGASLRITIAKWLTPLKRSIDKVGIEPDIKVPLTENDLKKNKDPQLEAALQILKK
jgi:carboxyl-terminal processing protease